MENDFNKWNNLKKEIHKKSSNIIFKEWDIWWCSLWKNIKSESFWKWEKFRRPILVFKKLSTDNCIVIPLSTKIKNWTWFCDYIQGWKNYTALLYQIRMVNKSRFDSKIWQIDELDFTKIKNRLKNLLNLF